MKHETVLITGGTGLIGKRLTSYLIKEGYDVIILSRKAQPSSTAGISYALWNIEEQKIDGAAIQQADYIINLAGAGVMDKSWTADYQRKIIDSRTLSSQLLIKGLSENKNKVKAIVAASAIGWYGEDKHPIIHARGFTEIDPPAQNFLGETCRLWEESIEPVTKMNIRLIRLRIGIVLSKEGGAFLEFLKPIKLGIAAILGSGKQVISWIHIDDLCRLFTRSITEETMHGTYNAVSETPVTNKHLIMKTANRLRKAFVIPIHVPSFILRVMLGQRSTEILKSATVDNAKIKGEGFEYIYPTLEAALIELTSSV